MVTRRLPRTPFTSRKLSSRASDGFLWPNLRNTQSNFRNGKRRRRRSHCPRIPKKDLKLQTRSARLSARKVLRTNQCAWLFDSTRIQRDKHKNSNRSKLQTFPRTLCSVATEYSRHAKYTDCCLPASGEKHRAADGRLTAKTPHYLDVYKVEG